MITGVNLEAEIYILRPLGEPGVISLMVFVLKGALLQANPAFYSTTENTSGLAFRVHLLRKLLVSRVKGLHKIAVPGQSADSGLVIGACPLLFERAVHLDALNSPANSLIFNRCI